MHSREDWLNRYSGKQLLKYHTLDEKGTWEIFGEDPNADWSGCHQQPSLGLYQGTLDQVINIAVSLNSFWQWGAGGNIEKRTITIIEK